MDYRGRAWAEISLDNLLFNYAQIKKRIGEKKIMAVVKADAYGHGAKEISRALELAGADAFAVASVSEALELRGAGIKKPILILAPISYADVPALIKEDIAVTAFDTESAEKLSAAAVKAIGTLKVHIKIDSGMSRIGIRAAQREQAVAQALRIAALPCLTVEGAFTHFAIADEREGEAFTRVQFQQFDEVCNALIAAGIALQYRHCANSAAVLDYPSTYLDMVRAGLILYGVYPGESRSMALRPVMQLKTRVTQIKTVEPGDTIGYGRTFTVTKPMTIAVVPIGYADGYFRLNSNQTDMLVHGKRARVTGRVCMDMSMLDITQIPGVLAGDIVTVFGQDGDAVLPVEETVKYLPSIPYEALCAINRRVPRIYIKNGTDFAVADYIL